MQILEHQNKRTRTAAIDEKLRQELERVRLDRLRARQSGAVAAARLDPEKMQQKRGILLGLHPDLAQRRTQLFIDQFRRVGVTDTTKAAQQVENEEVGD